MLATDPLWQRMLEVDQLVRNLDPAVRSVAFQRLLNETEHRKEEVSGKGEKLNGKRPGPHTHVKVTGDESMADFFSQHNHDRPSENVYLICAWLVGRGVAGDITKKEIDRVAGVVGIIVPERSDKTMSVASIEGRLFFKKLK